MMRTLRGYDKGLIVFGSLIVALAICSLAITGAVNTYVSYFANIVYNVHYGVGAWVLLIGILGIAAGATGSSGAYVAVIVLTILGTLSCVAGLSVSIWGIVVGTFNIGLEGRSSSNVIFSLGTANTFELSIGLLVVDVLTFVFLIVASCIACCGQCDGRTTPSGMQTTTVIHTGGAVMMHQPAPGYAQYPPQQGYAYPPQSGGYVDPAQSSEVPMDQYPQYKS